MAKPQDLCVCPRGFWNRLAWFNSMLAYQDRACTVNYATIYCKSMGWNVIEVPRYLPLCGWASFCACLWASFCACVLLRHPLGRTSSDKTCKEPCDCIRQCLGQWIVRGRKLPVAATSGQLHKHCMKDKIRTRASRGHELLLVAHMAQVWLQVSLEKVDL